jgi:hypothetical protein
MYSLDGGKAVVISISEDIRILACDKIISD